MARFIKKKNQQSINHSPSPIIHYLLLIIIIMEFIPLPDVPFTQFGPVYLVAWLSVLGMAFNFNKLANVSPIVIKIILLLLFYYVYAYVLAWAFDILDEKLIETAMPTIRVCAELLLFSIACTNLVELKRVLFTISAAILISASFGVLVYHFGEPFQSVRDWLLQSQMSFFRKMEDLYPNGLPGQGGRIIGLTGTHWQFGFLMSAAPPLALICGRLSSFKWVWAVVFLLLLYTLYLNGERAALLGSCVGVVSLLIIWRLVSIPYICMGLAVILSFYIFKPSTQQRVKQEDFTITSRISSSGKKDMEDRLKLWTASIVSVIEHPLTGPTQGEYRASYFGQENLIVANNPDRRIYIAHNAYLTTGVNIGLMGWFVVLFYFTMLKNIIIQIFKATVKSREEKIVFEGAAIVILAPMVNSLFQNEAIFTNEPTAICLNGLLISCHQILYNRNRCQT